MKTFHKYLVALGAVTLSATQLSPAMAQRQRTDEERQQTREERRERVQNMTPEQRQQMFQQRRQQMMQNATPEQRARMEQQMQQWQNATPAQREQMMQQMQGGAGGGAAARDAARWDWVRQTLTASGYTEAPLQDAVISFMQAQERARQPLQEQARALANSLVVPGVANEKLSADLAAFRQAVAADKARYDTELAALDTSVKYSATPKLEALLTVLGVVGAETPTLGGVGALFPDSPMGGGGRGGRGGRNRGGQNGAGGGNGGANNAPGADQ